MKTPINELMEKEVSKIDDGLELSSIYQSKGKYIGVIGYTDENRSDEAYENVLLYDPSDDSLKQIHITTALIEYPEEIG